MGMYGEYLRVTPDELARSIADPAWGRRLADSVIEAEFAEEPAEPRNYGTDKSWHGLQYLLQRAGFPLDIVTGEQSFVDDLENWDELADSKIDWGAGPPGYLTPEQVKLAAELLARTPFEKLIEGVEPAELTREHIYPQVWDRPGELEQLGHHYDYLPTYFAAAARAGDAVICWIA